MKSLLKPFFLVAMSLSLLGAGAAFSTPQEAKAATTNVVTSDTMVKSGQLYDSISASKGKLSPLNGVVASSGVGRIVYEGEATGVNLNTRITSGTSIFYVLRATGETAVWDSGHGYFLMVDKVSDAAIKLTLLRGAETGSSFSTIKEVSSFSSTFFDGEKHNLTFLSTDTTSGGATFNVSFDGTEALTGEDTGTAYSVTGSHFLIMSAQNYTMSKLYADDGVDVDPSSASYKTITSKTLLNSSSDWKVNGAIYTAGTSIVGNRDQSQVLFAREMSNVVYSYDITMSDIGSNWISVYLNANRMDALWNSGFRSVVIRFSETKVDIEYWCPQVAIASLTYSDFGVSLANKVHIDSGLYDMTTASGDTLHFVMLKINGVTLFNSAVSNDAVSFAAGSFGIFNFGTAKYTLEATTNEVDSLPSSSNGTKVTWASETLSQAISTEDFAIIGNSVNPTFDYEGNALHISNNGYLTYKNSVNFTKFAFTFAFKADNVTGESLDFSFGKKRQNSFINQTLSIDYANYGYSVRVYPNGTLELLKTDNGAGSKSLMLFDAKGDFGLVFGTTAHTLTIHRSYDAATGLTIALFIDNQAYGYSYTDTDYYADNYPLDGFISFGDTAENGSYLLSAIAYEGQEGNQSASLKADMVNFPTVFEKEGKKIVYFVFDTASYTTKWVEVYASDVQGAKGALLGKVYPGSRSLDITSYTGEYVLVVSVSFTEAGNKSVLLSTLPTTEAISDTSSVSRIATKEQEDGASFVKKTTGELFTPMGGNYMSLRGGDHSTFDAATSFSKADYDPLKAEAMFAALHKNGGNMVRVFLIGRSAFNPGISGDPAYDINDTAHYYEGLYLPYMQNVVHFLRTAQHYGCYVMMALGDADVPSNAYYLSVQGGAALDRGNLYFTTNGVKARTTYAKNVVNYFKTQAPDVMSGIFSLELQNEFAVYNTQYPFNQTTGSVTLANGSTYDMANTDSREAAYQEGTAYYINQMVDAIKGVDNDLLVNEGSFTRNISSTSGVKGMQSTNGTELRVPLTFDKYLATKIDFLDIHIYFAQTKGNTLINSFADDLTSMNFYDATTTASLKKKPLFMGEFGPSVKAFPTYAEAVQAFQDTVGYAKEAGFRGFCAWTFDSHSQTDFYNLMADDGKFDLFRSLVRIELGLASPENVTAKDVSFKLGEHYQVAFENLVPTDIVTYSLDQLSYSSTLPTFSAVGTYTLYYKVDRYGYDPKLGSLQVSVTGEDTPTSSSSGSTSTPTSSTPTSTPTSTPETTSNGGTSSKGCSCNSQSGVYGAIAAVGAAVLFLIIRKKRS